MVAAGLHFAAALKHRFVYRDSTPQRISFC